MGLSPSLFTFMRFLVSLFYLIFSASFSSVQPLCHNDESFALLKFKESFTINRSASSESSDYPNVSLWKPKTSDCCRWHGVKCNENTGHVISLDLSSNYLYGSINSNSSLFQLVHLRSLNLFDNHFNFSRIPTGFRQLSRLTNLNLSASAFSGQFTSEILELSNLISLDLSKNYGLKLQEHDLISKAQKLKNLKELHLGEVDISSTVPKIFANLSSLTSLSLYQCGLHGEFPTGIFHLPNLQSLDLRINENLIGNMPEFNRSSPLKSLALSQTSFFGELPGSIDNLKSLYYFDAAQCNFSGPIPSSLGNLTQLISLKLEHNRLHGSIPQSISRLVNLKYLGLSYNHLSGTLEFNLFLKLRNLSRLRLSYNNISLLTKPSTNATLPKFEILNLASCDLNEFPYFLRNQDKLYILDLSHNNLQGSLPIPPPSILWYSVSNNKLTGEIQQLICNLSSIVILDLSSNYLSGLLPQCLGNLNDSLRVLNLYDNNFHGTIPEIFTKGNKLGMIDFSQNQLQGRITRSLANCTMLEVLNLGNNQMKDTFPSWLGILPKLRVLILRYNGIYGVMGNPNSSVDFTNIRVIDLSHNDITGKLPSQYFQNWKAMRIVDVKGLMYMQDNNSYTYSMTFINKGTNLVYERILNFFMAIDLSSNKFEGEIPEVVGHLKGVKLLNFSNNLLTGPIPSCLGNLTELESLDLSQNNLTGVIPLQLTQLAFLGSFNISHNHLKGPIPQGNQFNTFPNSSFSNNPELCGSPLSKKCENSKDPPLTFEGNQNSESLFEFSWKIVAMGYGCGFMVGLVVGQIMIKKKHDWFMKTFAFGQPTTRRVNRRGHRNHI